MIFVSPVANVVFPGGWILTHQPATVRVIGNSAKVIAHLMIKVNGFCPRGCGETLYLHQGNVCCSDFHCPEEGAVTKILSDAEVEHIVGFGTSGFTIRHPLRERVNDEILECELGEYLSTFSSSPRELGAYRARPWGDKHWHFEEIQLRGDEDD